MEFQAGDIIKLSYGGKEFYGLIATTSEYHYYIIWEEAFFSYSINKNYFHNIPPEKILVTSIFREVFDEKR
jgi:hypothetical protein